MEKNLTIRNSTAEFLIFQAQDKSQGMDTSLEECDLINRDEVK